MTTLSRVVALIGAPSKLPLRASVLGFMVNAAHLWRRLGEEYRQLLERVRTHPKRPRNRRSLWVPSLQAVVGGVLVFQGVHVWTADTQTPEIRAVRASNLDAIVARNPSVVVTGHLAPEVAIDLSGVAHTKAYLLAFEEEIGKAADGAALQAAMEARFSGLGMGVALEIGSKVAKGEMKWG